MLFWKWGCLVGSENSIFWKLKSVDPKKKPLTTEIVLHFYFPFKMFPENERERERARAREIAISSLRSRRRWSRSPVRNLQSAIPRRRWSRSPVRDLTTPLIAISPSRDRTGSRSRSTARSREDRDLAVDRDLAKITISPSIAISPSQDRTRSRSRSTARTCKDHDLAFARSQSRRRLRSRIAIDGAVVGRCSVSSLMIFSWAVACVFLDLCFPSSFPNTRKYFPENFLKCNQTPWKHFPFPEISIFGKYVFSGKRFTPTKHSLGCIFLK